MVQAFVKTLPAQASQFILDELLAKGTDSIMEAARHRYSCRSLQRLLEHLTPGQLKPLVEALLANAISLSRHVYANYVMQHVVEHGTDAQRRRLTLHFAAESEKVCANCFACAVVSKALTFGCREDTYALVRSFASQPGLLHSMARSRHGHIAVRAALQHLEGVELDDMRAHLNAARLSLRVSRYGRLVVACLDTKESGAGDDPAVEPKLGCHLFLS